MNARNEYGWLIPREGNKSWVVYSLMMNGFSAAEIAELLQAERVATIRVMCSQIKNPKSKNASQLRYYHAHPERCKETRARSRADGNYGSAGSYSKYVRKLVKVLGISFTEAVALERKELEKENENKNRLQLSNGSGTFA